MTEQEKILDRLQKIKAHADSAKAIGSEAEAQAFAEMLQKLLLKHNLAMSDIDFERYEKEEPVQEMQVNWQDVQVRNVRVAWMETLASIVARAHFCRILVTPGSTRIWLVGRVSNAKVAEYMLVTLTRAVEKLSHDAAYRGGSEKGCTKGRGFRAAWINGFIQRLAERFREERVATETSSSMALVRLNKADLAVKNYMEDKYKKAKSSAIQGHRSYNSAGYQAGRSAASAINLKGKAVEGSSKPAGQLR